MKKGWETPVCNNCKSNDNIVVYDNLTYWEYPGKFRIVKCSICNLHFTSPRPNLNEIVKYYGKNDYFGIEQVKKEKPENTFKPVYELISKYKKKGKILDIGAGTGSFLSKYKDGGWEVEGVELTPAAVKYAKKAYDIKLRNGDLFSFKLKTDSYDVITMNEVLEHMHNPLETLIKINSLLNKNGFIVITVPNVAGFGRRIFGKDWFPWQPPRHLYHFSPSTLSEILKKAGFKKIVIKYNDDLQNRYILFQSLRYGKSPKFQKKATGGLTNPKALNKSTPSLKIQIAKIIGNILTSLLAFIEPFVSRGEVMVVIARK